MCSNANTLTNFNRLRKTHVKENWGASVLIVILDKTTFGTSGSTGTDKCLYQIKPKTWNPSHIDKYKRLLLTQMYRSAKNFINANKTQIVKPPRDKFRIEATKSTSYMHQRDSH